MGVGLKKQEGGHQKFGVEFNPEATQPCTEHSLPTCTAYSSRSRLWIIAVLFSVLSTFVQQTIWSNSQLWGSSNRRKNFYHVVSLSRWRPLWSTLAKLPDAKLLPAQPRCLLPSCKVPKYSQMKSLLKMKKLENPRVFPNDAPPWSTPAKMPDAKLLPAQPSCLLPRCRVPE